MGHEAQIRVQQLATGDEGTGGFLNKLKVWEDHFDKVKQVVDSMQPGKIDTAATAYDAVATRMDESVGLIYKQATRMVEAWGGEDAEKAMTQMNKAYHQAQEIKTTSDTTSNALTTHATTQRNWQKAYGSGSPMDSWVKDAVIWGERILATHPATAPAAIGGLIANNWGAEDAMQNINNGTQESNNNFPAGIRQEMPTVDPNVRSFDDPVNPGRPPGSPKMPGGGGGPGGGPGDVPGGPGGPEIPGGPGGPGLPPGGPGGPGLPPGGPEFPGGGGPGGGPGGGTDLASMPGGPGGGPGLGAGGVGGGPGGGPGLGSGPGGLGAGAGPGAGGMVGGPGGLGKNSPGGRGGMGMGMPMGAGARPGGDGGDEHERSTWLTEDEDVWGGNDDTAPPVIG